jgi:seryl-tRNA synthetase
MHDIKFIRENPEAFDSALKRRGWQSAASNDAISADNAVRGAQTELQKILAERNEKSAMIAQAKGRGDTEQASNLMASVSSLKAKIPPLEEQEQANAKYLRDLLAGLPNLPADDVPLGKDENDNVEVRRHGTPRTFDFTPLEHDVLGEKLGMDFETAAKLSGSRFVVLRGPLARLERALAQYMLDVQTRDHGFVECAVPYLVRADALFGTGQLPKFEDDMFKTTSDHYLISTAEISLTNLVRESIVDSDELPMRLTAYTPCFRSEAGASGKDTRGMIRQHQFGKVEMVSITTPDQSNDEHERMVECAESVLKNLGLPFRTMLLCTGDMGFAARKTYDLEVWLPGQGKYREISSISNCGDFQARRMNARTKAKGEKSTRFVHTLNGSGLAVGRTLVAVLENYQNADGSVTVPDVLIPYMGGQNRIDIHPNTMAPLRKASDQ